MKIMRTKTITPVAFGELDVGVVFTSAETVDSGCFYMSCYDVDYNLDIEEPFNAVSLDDDNDSGTLVHFDDDEMVIPYYNCTLTVS